MRKVIIGIFVVSLVLISFGNVSYAEWAKGDRLVCGNSSPTESMLGSDYKMPGRSELTRFGAEFKGNADGSIPDFEGAKNLECPKNYKKGMFLQDPYADDPVLFKIDHTNVDQYKDKLSLGQIARLKRNKFFYLAVKKSHRQMEFCDIYDQATMKNMKTAYTDENKVLRGFNGGVPFPEPKNGLEAIWNAKKPWAGNDLITDDCKRVVSPRGKVRKTILTSKIMAFDNTRVYKPVPNPEGVALKIVSFTSYPADRYGEATLIVTYMDDNIDEDIWQYIPSLRRVRRAPTLGGGTQAIDSEQTNDQTGFGYRGPIKGWTWKLIGKKEMYVASNNYSTHKLNAKDEEECLPGDFNPALLRYELHRVWVVESVADKDLNHPYSRRFIFFDEDHWTPVFSDNYDKRGNLWRIGEYFQQYDYCEKHRVTMSYMYLNLESTRYVFTGGCRTPETRTNQLDIDLKAEEFTVQWLRTLGR